MGKLACAGGRAREEQSFCAAELQSNGLRLVSFEGEGTEHVGCLVAPSLARLKSFHHSLARSLTTTRLADERASFLSSSPPCGSVPPHHNTASSVDPRGSRCQVGCRLSTRAMGDPRRSDISTCHKREAAASSPPKTKGRCRLLLTLHSSAKLMVIGNTEHLIVLPVTGSPLKTRSEVAGWDNFKHVKGMGKQNFQLKAFR